MLGPSCSAPSTSGSPTLPQPARTPPQARSHCPAPPPLRRPAQATIREAVLDRPHAGGPRLRQEGPLLPENRRPTHTPEALALNPRS